MRNQHLILITCCVVGSIHLIHSGQKLLLLCAFLLLLAYGIFYKRHRAILLVVVFSSLVFSMKAILEMNALKSWSDGQSVDITIYFNQPLDQKGSKLRSIVETNGGEKLLFESSIQDQSRMNLIEKTLRPGIQCRVKGEIKQPPSATNFHAFDYRQYLHSKGVFWVIHSDFISSKDCSVKNSFFSFTPIFQIHDFIIKKINETLPSPTRELTLALLLGDRDKLKPEVLEAYEHLGIVHLLAISGLHVSLLSILLIRVAIRIGITREGATIFVIVILPIYAILTGATPSVVRAVIMAVIVLMAVLWKVRISLLRIFFLTFFLVLFFQPFTIYAVGFQLSYGVTLGLILSARIFSEKSREVKRLFLVSFIAFIASLPFLLFHFFTFSPYSVFLNILYVPLYSFILLPLSWLLALCSVVFGNAPLLLVEFSNKLIYAADFIALFFDRLPLFSLIIGRPKSFQLFHLIMGSLLLFLLLEKKKARPLLLLFIGSLMYASFTIQNIEAEITIIDIGQGDSILIQLPFNKGTYLIDTGGASAEWQAKNKNSYVAAKEVVIPYLQSLGISKIDKLILSHGDLDHAGGATILLKDIGVKELVIGRKINDSDLEKEIMGIAKAENVPIQKVQAGDYWQTNYAYFEVVSPVGNESNENDSSVVIKAVIADTTFLFAGDISVEIEQRLISTHPSLQADFLKLAHHGSNTSTSVEFLQAVNPQFAIISAGKNNWYGHPHEEVLKRLENQNVKVLRTDQHGAILIKINPFTNGTIQTKHP